MIKACSQRTLVPTGSTSFDVLARSEKMRCLVNGSATSGLRTCQLFQAWPPIDLMHRALGPRHRLEPDQRTSQAFVKPSRGVIPRDDAEPHAVVAASP